MKPVTPWDGAVRALERKQAKDSTGGEYIGLTYKEYALLERLRERRSAYIRGYNKAKKEETA